MMEPGKKPGKEPGKEPGKGAKVISRQAGRIPEMVRRALGEPGRLAIVDAASTGLAGDDPDFERIARLTARLFNTPIGLVTLLGDKVQRFAGRSGIDVMTSPAEDAFCSHTICDPAGIMVVRDASVDARFSENPLVAGEPFLRFYAGAPVVVEGKCIGTVCALSAEAGGEPDGEALEALADFAALCGSLFAMKQKSRHYKIVQDELKVERSLHKIAVEAGKAATWVWNTQSDRVLGSHMLRELHGLPEEGPVALDDILDAIHKGDLESVSASLKAAVETGSEYTGEFRIGNTGRWLFSRGQVGETDENGRARAIFGVSLDITESKKREDKTRLLLREVNHRVKNTLAMLQSLTRQTLRRYPDPNDFMEAFSGRLMAIGDSHTLLSDAEWSQVSLGRLIDQQVHTYIIHDANQVLKEGTEVYLSPDQALGIGLFLHELATNAAKYGALSTCEGKVVIRWHTFFSEEEDRRRLVLEWEESGGPPVESDFEEGFGLVLIKRSLDKIINSRISLETPREGVRASVSMPLT